MNPTPLPFHSNNLLFLSAQFYSVQETYFFYFVGPRLLLPSTLLRKRLLWTLSLSSTITDETIIVGHCWDRSRWQMANLRTTVRWIRQIKSLSFGSIWSLACVSLPPRLCGYNPDDFRTKIVSFGIMNDIARHILACMSCLLIPTEEGILFLKHLLTILSLLLFFFKLHIITGCCYAITRLYFQ